MKLNMKSVHFIACMYTLGLVAARDVLVLTDVHYQTNLTDSCSYGFCYDLGTYGDDSPLSLIELVLDKAQAQIKEEGDKL